MAEDLAALRDRTTKLVDRLDGVLQRFDGNDHKIDPVDVEILLIHVRRLLELSAEECEATLMDLALNPDHHACPCRRTGQHRIHRCEHGTEWWPAAEGTS